MLRLSTNLMFVICPQIWCSAIKMFYFYFLFLVFQQIWVWWENFTLTHFIQTIWGFVQIFGEFKVCSANVLFFLAIEIISSFISFCSGFVLSVHTFQLCSCYFFLDTFSLSAYLGLIANFRFWESWAVFVNNNFEQFYKNFHDTIKIPYNLRAHHCYIDFKSQF